MKINSETLYRQWHNLTTICPGRCDPNWIDLGKTNISDEKLLADIESAQESAISGVPKGYGWFIEDMASLLKEHPSEVVPRVGSSKLQLRYQAPMDNDGNALFFEYYIVPKVSRVCAPFACPGNNFSTVKRAGRFSLSSVASSRTSFDPEAVRHMMKENGPDYYLINREYLTEPPMPTDLSRGSRGAVSSAETEWMDLNLLANFQFNRDSVALLYLPVTGKCRDTTLTEKEVVVQRRSYYNQKLKYLPAEMIHASRIGTIKGAWDKRYSNTVKITAMSAMYGTSDIELAKIAEEFSELMSAEAFTDVVTERDMISDETISKATADYYEDQDQEEAYDPLSAFIFSVRREGMPRDPDPSHPSRKEDSNRGRLFGPPVQGSLIEAWYVKVFDAASGEFIPKTVEEWMIDCLIDDVRVVNKDRVVSLLDRGLSIDNILYISSLVDEATPEKQFEEVVKEFIEEEHKLNLRYRL